MTAETSEKIPDGVEFAAIVYWSIVALLLIGTIWLLNNGAVL